LEHAYKVCDLTPPWKFWNLRDTRTLYDIGKVNLKDFEKSGVPHNSLYDCYKQTLGLHKALENLKG
jgi:hypothetical protein